MSDRRRKWNVETTYFDNCVFFASFLLQFCLLHLSLASLAFCAAYFLWCVQYFIPLSLFVSTSLRLLCAHWNLCCLEVIAQFCAVTMWCVHAFSIRLRTLFAIPQALIPRWLFLQMRLLCHMTTAAVNRRTVLPSELTNTVTDTIEQFNHESPSEWSTFHLHLCISYRCIWGWQHLPKPSPNVISPIFFAILFRPVAPPILPKSLYYISSLILLCWLLECWQHSQDTQPPATASNALLRFF